MATSAPVPADLAVIRAGFVAAHLDPRLVDELLLAYVEAKRNYYLGNLRPSEVEGGRFCEAAYRLLQQVAMPPFTPIGKPIDTDKISQDLLAPGLVSLPDSVRLHIPRALRVVYDIRNRRDAAHLADGIDPNMQDATLVTSVLDWVLAEFVRLYHNVPADEAQRIVEGLVTRKPPVVQDFRGFFKVLNPALPSGDHVLVLLYQVGAVGATYDELHAWARPSMRSNLRRTLRELVDQRALVHFDDGRYHITYTGMQEVENRRLYQMPDRSTVSQHRPRPRRRRSARA